MYIEAYMNIDITDIVVHIHPEVTAELKGRIDENLRALNGVIICAF
jgi:hypothetical protein